MLSDAEFATIADFVGGQCDDRQLRELLIAAAANPELRAALIELAPARAVLQDPELSGEFFGESHTAAAADTTSGFENDDETDQGFEELRRLIRQICPTEWNMAGSAVVDDILQGHTDFAGAPGGHPLSTTSALRTIIGATGLIKGLLHLRRALSDLQRRGADESEIEATKATGIATLDAQAASTLRADRRRRAIDLVLGTPTA